MAISFTVKYSSQLIRLTKFSVAVSWMLPLNHNDIVTPSDR